MRPVVILIILFSFIAGSCFSQTSTIDSLKKNIAAASGDEEKIKAIFNLCELGYTLHPDTLMFYAGNARKIANRQSNLHDEIKALYYQSGALTTKGLIDSSLNLANYCLSILTTKLDDPVLEANLFNQKGRCYVRKNQYKEAIDMGLQTISVAEKMKDVLLQIKGKTLIGWAYLEMGQVQESLAWHLKALKTTTDTVLLQKYGILFANLALNYNGLKKTDSAFYFINKAIYSSRKFENLFALSNSLAIQAQLLVSSGQAKSAEPVLKEVVDIRKLIGDPFYIASDLSQLGLYYAHNGQPEKGIAVCNEGIAIAKKYSLDTKLFFLYSSLADNYKALGNIQGYASVLESIIALKDSVYQNNSASSLAEMQARYDLQKKENLIIQQKLDIQEKNYLFYGSLLLLLFASLISWLLFKEYLRKQKIKVQAMQEEEKILSVIAVTKAEEHERKRIAADLHDNIGAYASAIRTDIEKIADKGFENNGASLQNLQQHSQEIINSLRDTIWVLNKDNITITSISDRIKNYISKLRPTYDHIQFHISEEIQIDARLSSQHALNIFRIVQEAIHNAVKHSEAANISIGIISNKYILIKINDDGKGIEKSNATDGNGLLNMKARAREIGMQLSVSSKANEGTSLFLETGTTN